MGASSHISWRTPNAESVLTATLGRVGHRIEELPSQDWDADTATIGGVRDYQLSNLAPRDDGWSFLLLHLNSELGEPLAGELSKGTDSPVIIFHEFDQCAWGFRIYQSGAQVAQFWNDPDVVDIDRAACSPAPEFVAVLFSVNADAIAPYLEHIQGDEEPGKAYEDDEFTLDDHWVRCDFMRRLGLEYRDPGTPGSRCVFIREPGVNNK